MVAIVGVTAVLVNAPPARTEVEMHEAVETELELGPFMAHMKVMPAMAGRNEIHFEFTGERPDEIDVSASLPSKDIGPLRYKARRGDGAGRVTWSRRRTWRPRATGRLRSRPPRRVRVVRRHHPVSIDEGM